MAHILAIETSCDETAITIIKTGGSNALSFQVRANLVASQVKLHARWGGVVPNLAKREHQKNLAPLLLQALEEANLPNVKIKMQNAKLQFKIQKSSKTKNRTLKTILERESELFEVFQKHILPIPIPDIDIIAVTRGPGLEPALWVGVNFARALSYIWGKPLIGINHMEGHILSALLEQKGVSNFSAKGGSASGEQLSCPQMLPTNICEVAAGCRRAISKIQYPAIALLVSGGHTELVLIKRLLKYKIIGETRDDAAGEAFDKVARILGLSYPGGPAIATEAAKTLNPKRYTLNPKLPRPMLNTQDFDFSFSGLKTAVLYLVKNLEKEGYAIKNLRPTIAKEFQDAVVDVLIAKTIRAAKRHKVKIILLGGGVAANTQLRQELGTAIRKNIPDSKFYIPDSRLTGDNALMIAASALVRGREAKKTAWKTLRPHANMRL